MDIAITITIVLFIISAALTWIVAILVLRAVEYFKRRNQPLYLNPDEFADTIMKDIEEEMTNNPELIKEIQDDLDSQRWDDEGGR